MNVKIEEYQSKGRIKYQIVSATEQASIVVCDAFGYGFNSVRSARKYLKMHPHLIEVGGLPEQLEFTPLFFFFAS